MSAKAKGRSAAAAVGERLTFLAEASRVLASSLDYHATLAAVARLAVPRIADWCAVDVIEPDGSLRRLAVAHADPEKLRLAEELQRRYPPDPGRPDAVQAVVRSGQSQIMSDIPEELVLSAARDEEHRRLLQALGLTSGMIVPLTARGRTLGAITLVAAESGHHYGPGDLALAEDLAGRGATAIDNALLFRETNRLAAIFTHAPDPILTMDREARILDLNPATEQLYGWRRDELIGRSVLVLLSPHEHSVSQLRLTGLWEGEALAPREAHSVTRSGESRHVLISATLLRDEAGRPLSAVALLRDITELKAAQDELQASVAQLQLIAELDSQVMAVQSRAELYQTLVTGLAGRYGYDAVSLYTVNPSAGDLELQAWRGFGSDRVPEGFRLPAGGGLAGLAVQTGQTQHADDVSRDPRCVRPVPDLAPGAELAVPLAVRGRVAAVLVALSLRPGAFGPQHRSALEAIGHRCTLALDRLALLEELQARSEEMETFLYATSHDLRSPLVNVLGFSQELQEAMHDVQAWASRQALPEAAQAELAAMWQKDILPALRFIGASVKKMEALVDGLLQLSRIGSQPLNLEAVGVGALVQEVLDGMRAELAGAAVEVGPLPPVEADRNRLSQVFANLIENAVKYADPGRPCRIRIAGEARDGWCRYCVADNGIGMAPEHSAQIFKPFHRLNLQDGKSGHGLGLSIVERVVRRHGGRVWVESSPGGGSTFWVELPAHPEL